jgi:DNA-binding MarR family transcriptional regulator
MLSGAATTKLTTRLEKAGLIRRERLERDGRGVLLALTATGRDLVETEFPRCLEGP